MTEATDTAAVVTPAEPDEAEKPAGFYGVVVLKEAMLCPDGRWYHGIRGWVTIAAAKELIGFLPGKTEANWVATIAGCNHRGERRADGALAVHVLGCQIRAAHQLVNPENFYEIQETPTTYRVP